MPAPKQRHTKSRRNRRRSHLALKARQISFCPKCKKEILPHNVCKNCGYYKGRQVIDVLGKLEKREKREKQKELKEAEKEKPLSMEDLSKK
jgi:large subunit ribosomal protein L32